MPATAETMSVTSGLLHRSLMKGEWSDVPRRQLQTEHVEKLASEASMRSLMSAKDYRTMEYGRLRTCSYFEQSPT